MTEKESELANIAEQWSNLVDNVQSLEDDVMYFADQGTFMHGTIEDIKSKTQSVDVRLANLKLQINTRQLDINENYPNAVCLFLTLM